MSLIWAPSLIVWVCTTVVLWDGSVESLTIESMGLLEDDAIISVGFANAIFF